MDDRTEIKEGDEGEDVFALQDLLNRQQGCNLKNDGKFGPITLAQVLDYQAARRLRVTGVVDKETWAVLDDPVQPAMAPPPEPPVIVPNA